MLIQEGQQSFSYLLYRYNIYKNGKISFWLSIYYRFKLIYFIFRSREI